MSARPRDRNGFGEAYCWFICVAALAISLQAPAQIAANLHGSTAPLNIYDGFEAPPLSALWDTSRMEPGAVVFESKVVRAGHGAIALTVRPHDKFEPGAPHNAESERDELMEARSLVPHLGRAQEYSFSEYFPLDFPVVPVRLVIAQWKQYCPETSTLCDNNSPVLAFRYIGGVFSVTQDLGGSTITLFEQPGEFRGRWHDFRVQARFVPTPDGHVKVWLDGKLILDHRGITAYPETPASGYPKNGYIYFKMGLYRNLMPEPMTVYIDEYRKRDLTDAEF